MAVTAKRIHFPGIDPAAFEHPLDRAALEALRKAPGLDLLFKKLASLGFERQVRLHFTGDSLRLSPQQCPDLFTLMRESAAVLDMAEPELYLWQNPYPNAFAIGMSRYTIVMTSGLVDLLEPDEVRAVIAHELGHIKSGHMLYRTIAIFLSLIGLIAARNLPFVNLITEALVYAFYDWSRKSELTADRAGLLVAQDPQVSIRVLLKLAGGATGAASGLNEAEFVKQADEYEDMGDNLLDMFYQFEMTRFQSHPFPALRAREIQRWSQSDAYKSILQGEYPRADTAAPDRRCPRCATAVTNPLFRFCPECGAEI